MSYILEALKKSERERKSKAELPDLQSLYVPSAQKKTVQPLWFLVIFICVCNLCFLGFWLYKNYWVDDDITDKHFTDKKRAADEFFQSTQPSPSLPDSSTGSSPSSGSQRQPELIKVPDIPLTQPVATLQKIPAYEQEYSAQEYREPYREPQDSGLSDIELAEGETLIQPRAANKARVAKPAQAADSWESIPRLKELSTSFQRQIPDLVFLSHMYSGDSALRSVVINGDLLREKDVITGDLIVEGIYEQGVVLRLSGQKFRVSVLEDWSFR